MNKLLSFILLVFSMHSVTASDVQETLKAAKEGDAYAQFDLGFMYVNGKGVAQDNKQAYIWFKKSADQGNASAQSRLCAMYIHSKGVQQDYSKAAVWCEKSAKQGHDYAKFDLGTMYINGDGVPQDYKKAYMWFSLVQYDGLDISQSMALIASKMTPEEINIAKDMSKLCLESSYSECDK